MKKFLLGTLMSVSLTAGGMAAIPASAQDYRYHGGYGQDRGGDYRGYGRDHRVDYREGYRYRGYRDGYHARADYRDRYYRERCSDGTAGTIIGAIAGGLLGGEIGRGSSYRGRSTTGTIIGAGAGALAGHALDGGDCRR